MIFYMRQVRLVICSSYASLHPLERCVCTWFGMLAVCECFLMARAPPVISRKDGLEHPSTTACSNHVCGCSFQASICMVCATCSMSLCVNVTIKWPVPHASLTAPDAMLCHAKPVANNLMRDVQRLLVIRKQAHQQVATRRVGSPGGGNVGGRGGGGGGGGGGPESPRNGHTCMCRAFERPSQRSP